MNTHILRTLKAIFMSIILLPIGCTSDFLENYPIDQMMSPVYYNNDSEVLKSTAALYTRPWFLSELNTSMMIGDSRAGVAFNSEINSSFNGPNHSWLNTRVAVGSDIERPWMSYYAINTHALAIKENIEKYSKPEVSEMAKNQAIGECYFMQSIAYFHLVCTFDNVPIIDNLASSLNKNHRLNTRNSVWEFLIDKMEKAVELLPEITEKGKVNKWAAKAMLSRYYLYMAAVKSVGGTRDVGYLNKAKNVAEDVIQNGPYKLLDNYEDLFKTAFDNNSESIFALQWIFGGGYGYDNRFQEYYAFSPSITGNGKGWGGGHGATFYILDKFFSRKESTRLRATYFVDGQKYDYIHQIVPDPSDATKTIEVPLEYKNTTRAHIKKGIVGLARDNNGQIDANGNGLNTYKMRYSEVLLNYVEAVIGLGGSNSTADAKALSAYNSVRQRAKMPIVTSVSDDDLYSEREMEFTQERLLWYECVKQFYYMPEKLFTNLNAQNRTQNFVITRINATTFDYTIAASRVQTIQTESGTYPNAGSIFLPVPDYEKTMDPDLALEPVEYNK